MFAQCAAYVRCFAGAGQVGEENGLRVRGSAAPAGRQDDSSSRVYYGKRSCGTITGKHSARALTDRLRALRGRRVKGESLTLRRGVHIYSPRAHHSTHPVAVHELQYFVYCTSD